MSHHVNDEIFERIFEVLIEEGYSEKEAADMVYERIEQLPEADISEKDEEE